MVKMVWEKLQLKLYFSRTWTNSTFVKISWLFALQVPKTNQLYQLEHLLPFSSNLAQLQSPITVLLFLSLRTAAWDDFVFEVTTVEKHEALFFLKKRFE